MTAGGGFSRPSRSPAAVRREIQRGLVLLLGVLVLQNALGVYVNLFVTLSLPANLGTVFPVIFSNPILILHALAALVLVAGSIRFLVARTAIVGVRFRQVAAVMLVVVAVTSYMGYHFVGTQENVYSFAMEMGFLATLVLALYLRHLLGAVQQKAELIAATA